MSSMHVCGQEALTWRACPPACHLARTCNVIPAVDLAAGAVAAAWAHCWRVQVLMLTDAKVPGKGPEVSLLVRDACEPGPAADVLTVISWTLPQHLTALSIGPLAAPCPNDVLVTLATLTNLQSLRYAFG